MQRNCYWGEKIWELFEKEILNVFYTNYVVSVKKNWRFLIFSGCVPWGKTFDRYNIGFLVTTNLTFCIEQAEQTTIWTIWTARRKFSHFSLLWQQRNFFVIKNWHQLNILKPSKWILGWLYCDYVLKLLNFNKTFHHVNRNVIYIYIIWWDNHYILLKRLTNFKSL